MGYVERLPALQLLVPESLPKPLGRYSHLSIVRGSELVSVAGQVAVDQDGNWVSRIRNGTDTVQSMAAGETHTDIARDFNVSHQTIGRLHS